PPAVGGPVDLPAPRLQRAGHRRRDQAEDEGAEVALPAGHRLPDRLRHHAIHPRVDQGSVRDAGHRLHAGGAGGAGVPAKLAVGLVLSAVFIPCAFIGGIIGQFFRQFALTIAISTLLSAFNSLTLSPALSALLLKPRDKMGSDVLPRLSFVLLGALTGVWVAWRVFVSPATTADGDMPQWAVAEIGRAHV